jgi:hypothetical protein
LLLDILNVVVGSPGVGFVNGTSNLQRSHGEEVLLEIEQFCNFQSKKWIYGLANLTGRRHQD